MKKISVKFCIVALVIMGLLVFVHNLKSQDVLTNAPSAGYLDQTTLYMEQKDGDWHVPKERIYFTPSYGIAFGIYMAKTKSKDKEIIFGICFGYIPFLVEIFDGSAAPAPHGAGAGRCYDLDSEPLCNARCSIGI